MSRYVAVFTDESSAHEIANVLMHFDTRRKKEVGVIVEYYNHHRTIAKGKLLLNMETKALTLKKNNRRRGKHDHKAFANGTFILANSGPTAHVGNSYYNIFVSQWWFTDSTPPACFNNNVQQ